jgi:hypothetical protein
VVEAAKDRNKFVNLHTFRACMAIQSSVAFERRYKSSQFSIVSFHSSSSENILDGTKTIAAVILAVDSSDGALS